MLRPLLAILILSLPLHAQEKPLPDRTQFLTEFQVKRPGIYKLMGDSDRDDLLSQYTYKETIKEMSLDSSGKAKSTQQSVIEHIPTRIVGFIYERQIVKNGVPLTAKELAKQDEKNEAQVRKWESDIRKFGENAMRDREKARNALIAQINREADNQHLSPEARKKKMEEALDAFNHPKPFVPRVRTMADSTILQASDFQLVGRETLDGRSVIVLTFKPKPGFKGGSMYEKILQHTTGKIWATEDDYQMMKIEATLLDAMNFGLGLLAKIQPGSKGIFEWRKINDDVWLPFHSDFTAKARILLIKGMNTREVHEFSDYKKYVVSTQVKPVP
jgi:hypothetical protein